MPGNAYREKTFGKARASARLVGSDAVRRAIAVVSTLALLVPLLVLACLDPRADSLDCAHDECTVVHSALFRRDVVRRFRIGDPDAPSLTTRQVGDRWVYHYVLTLPDGTETEFPDALDAQIARGIAERGIYAASAYWKQPGTMLHLGSRIDFEAVVVVWMLIGSVFLLGAMGFVAWSRFLYDPERRLLVREGRILGFCFARFVYAVPRDARVITVNIGDSDERFLGFEVPGEAPIGLHIPDVPHLRAALVAILDGAPPNR